MLSPLDRRGVLLLAAGAGVGAAGPITAQPDANAELAALLDAYARSTFDRHPELVTALGLDRGSLAPARWQLDERSVERIARDREILASYQRQLHTIDRARLSPRSALHYDVFHYELMRERAVADWQGLGRPYVIDQFDHGAYANVPRLLAAQHNLEGEEDANAWLARLGAFPKALDQELECMRFDAARGIVPPDFIVGVTVAQIEELAQAPAADSFVLKSLAARSARSGISANHFRSAAGIWDRDVVPALRRQAEALSALRASATSVPGIWRLPDGEALYAALLQYETTTAMSAAETHAVGLQTVDEISARIDERMRAVGMGERSVARRLRSMFEDSRFRHADNETGREQMLADAHRIAARARAHLPESFATLPRAEFTIRPMPPYLEAGAAGQYDAPPLDGSRPGVFWINLGDPAETSSFLLPTILHHEGVPGHHLQLSLAAEATNVPLALKLWDFTAYSEGWATYAEQLADEWGLYDEEPWSRIGYLQQALLRAARLVVDTGLHAMRWSRAQALSYLAEVTGSPDASNISEMNRYCVEPAQALSYMTGKLQWLRLRERARSELGSRFDLRDFHAITLQSGSMPMAVLERVVQDYIRGRTQ